MLIKTRNDTSTEEKTSKNCFLVRVFIGLFAKNNLLLLGRKINTIPVVIVLIREFAKIPLSIHLPVCIDLHPLTHRSSSREL